MKPAWGRGGCESVVVVVIVEITGEGRSGDVCPLVCVSEKEHGSHEEKVEEAEGDAAVGALWSGGVLAVDRIEDAKQRRGGEEGRL